MGSGRHAILGIMGLPEEGLYGLLDEEERFQRLKICFPGMSDERLQITDQAIWEKHVAAFARIFVEYPSSALYECILRGFPEASPIAVFELMREHIDVKSGKSSAPLAED